MKLSSNSTNISLYGSAIFILIMIPVTIWVSINQKFHLGMLLGGAVLLAFIGFTIYLFIYTCKAYVVDNKLVLKKQFRDQKEYSFDKIGYPTSFRLKSTKYITVEITNDDSSKEKYVILNSKALLSFENKDAEQVLITLRNRAMASAKKI